MHISFSSLLFTLFIILIALQISGELFRSIKQPAVVGEMVAGILLGPTLLGYFYPSISEYLFTSDILSGLSTISNIGLTLYMFFIGMELNIGKFNSEKGKQVTYLSLFGFLPSFILGALSSFFFLSKFGNGHTIIFIIFSGLIMSITALPVIARILHEKQLMHTKLGSIILLVAAIDDILAWTLLAFLLSALKVNSLANGWITFGGIILFIVITICILKPILYAFGQKIERQGILYQRQLVLILILILGAASITEFLGVHTILGAFIFGMCIPNTSLVLRSEINRRLEPLVVTFLMPLYFVHSGLQTDLTKVLFNIHLFFPTIVIIFTTFICKYGFCTIAIRRLGYSWQEASAYGGLLNAKGVMGLIISNIGLSTGILTADIFSIFIIMIVSSTALATPIYNLSSKLSGRHLILLNFLKKSQQ